MVFRANSSATCGGEPPADTVYTNGKFYTVNEAQPWAEAVAIKDGRFVYVGDNPAKDFVAPRALGWRTVRVRRHGQLHHEVPSGDDVDVEITSLDQLEAALDIG